MASTDGGVAKQIIIQKNPRVRKYFGPKLRGRKWLRLFYGRLESCVLSAKKNLHAHKIPRFFLGGRGEVPILVLWARIFLG